MIARLLRHDRAMMGILVLWPGAIILGVLTSEVLGSAGEAGGQVEPLSGPESLVFAIVASIFASINYFAGGGTRVASRFQMGLPIPGRALWIARMVAIYAPFGGAVLIGLSTFALTSTRPVEEGFLVTAMNVMGLIVFIPALYHAGRVSEADQGMPLAAFFPLLALALAPFGLTGLRSALPGLLLWGCSAVLLAVTFARVPGAFHVSGGAARQIRRDFPVARAVLAELERVPAVASGGRLLQALRPVRWLNRDQFTLLVLLGGSVNVLLLLRSPLTALVTPVILQVAWFIRTMNGAARLDHLPLSRERVFRHAVLPPWVLLAGVLSIVTMWSDALTASLLVNSSYVATSVVVFVMLWGLALGTVLEGVSSRAARGWRHVLWRPVAWGWVFLAGGVAVARWGVGGEAGVLEVLSARAPLSPLQIWILAGVVLGAAYGALRAQFRGVELVTLSRGMVS